jgi:ABC-type nitrate/sulfonate/bicarbonate transport system permease component
VFACVLMLSVLGIIFYFVVEAIERLVVSWHVSARQLELAGETG